MLEELPGLIFLPGNYFISFIFKVCDTVAKWSLRIHLKTNDAPYTAEHFIVDK